MGRVAGAVPGPVGIDQTRSVSKLEIIRVIVTVTDMPAIRIPAISLVCIHTIVRLMPGLKLAAAAVNLNII